MKKFTVTQKGEKLSKDKYNWDSKTNTFSTNEHDLVLDFSFYSNCTFYAGSDCTFNAGSNCTFYAGSYCTFKTYSNCTFNVGSYCTFKTVWDCTFNTDFSCTFNAGSDCTFNTGSDCTFKTDSDCTFNTDYNCTFNVGSDCTFKTGYNCVIVRQDVFEVIVEDEGNNIIQLPPHNIKGHIKNGYYSETNFKEKAIVADNVLSIIKSKKKIDDLTMFKVVNHGEKETSFLIKRGDIYSHGETLKEAEDSLIYKISDRCTDEFKKYTLDTVISSEKAIQIYRKITGACEHGVRNFVSSLVDAPKEISIKNLIELTKNNYGNDKFKSFFCK